jgi:hypothetical protein
MNNGWIKIHRKIIDWEWYKDANTFRLFLHLLLIANRNEKKYKGTLIGIGQIMTCPNKLARELDLTISKIRTSLNKLKLTNEITIETNTKGSIIQIVNYKNYQLITNDLANKSQSNSNQIATNNNVIKDIYSESDFLERWKAARLHYDKLPTNITELKHYETPIFNKIVKKYTSKEIDEAISGLFFQKTYLATRLRPTHFLENFEQYLTCWKNKEKLFENKKYKKDKL